MDELIQIKCPFDGAVLKVKNVPGIEKKNVTCPICKHKFPFTEFKKITPPPPSSSGMESEKRYLGEEPTTYQFGSGGPKQETTVLGNPNMTLGMLVNRNGGMQYRLKPGKNVIGRKASQSQATIRIDTGTNRSMSREHLVIDVRNVPTKGFVHYISLYKEKVNKTTIGNVELMYGDCMVLEAGDIIRLPDAELMFVIPDDEGTVI